MWRSTIEANELGLWRATDGTLTALANVGPANPREFTEVTSTTEALVPDAYATGGDGCGRGRRRRARAAHRSGALERRLQGRRLAGVAHARSSVVRGIGVLPVFAGLIGLLLLIGSLAATWMREGR